MKYFQKREKILITRGVLDDLNVDLITLIIDSVFKIKYKKDYLQVITFEKTDEGILMHIKQEKTNRVEAQDTKILIKKDFIIPEKLYFIEDIYPTKRVQTLLFAYEY